MTARALMHGRLASCLFSLLLCVPLAAEVTVTIVAPVLKPGMAKLQTMLEGQVQSAADGIAGMAGAALAKPLLMSALAQSNGTAALPQALPASPRGAASVSLGLFAGVQTDTWDTEALAERIEAFRIEDDYAVGAGARPLALDLLLPFGAGKRLLLRLSASFMQAQVQGYTFRGLGAGASLGFSLIRPIGRDPFFRWEGLSVGAGAAFERDSLSTVVSPGLIEQTLAFDPDGAGPLPLFDLVVQVEPAIAVTVGSSALVFPVGLRSGVSFFDTFSLSLGGGVDLAAGWTSIALAGEPEIVIQGYLADLIEEAGRIEVNGSVDQREPVRVRPYAYAELELRLGFSSVAVSALYRAEGGLAAGVSLGVSLR